MYFITFHTWDNKKGEFLFSSKNVAMQKAHEIIRKYAKWKNIIEELRSSNCQKEHLHYINELWNNLGEKKNRINLDDELPVNMILDEYVFALAEVGTNVNSRDAYFIIDTNFMSTNPELPLYWYSDELCLELVDFENCYYYEYVNENGGIICHNKDTFDAFIVFNIITKGKHLKEHSLSYINEATIKSKYFKRHMAKLSALGYTMYESDYEHEELLISEDDILFSNKKRYNKNILYGLETEEPNIAPEYQWGGSSYTLLVYEVLNNATNPLLQHEIIAIIKEKYGSDIPIVRSTISQAIKNLQSPNIGCQIKHKKDGYLLIKE